MPNRFFKLSAFILTLALVGLVKVVFSTQTVHAQFFIPAAIPMPTTTVQDIPAKIKDTVKTIKDKTAKALKVSSDITFKSTLQIFETQLIRQAETSLATRAPGQQPLFITNPKTFFKNVANSSAGKFIDDYTRGVSGGRLVGAPLSGERGKFLISQLLGDYLDDSVEGKVNQCVAQCITLGADMVDEKAIVTMSPEQFKRDLALYTNDHARKIAFMYYQMYGPTGTQAQLDKVSADKKDTASGECIGIAEGRTNSGVISYVIEPDAVYPEGWKPLKECLHLQNQAYLIEKSNTQTDVEQCRSNCMARGTAATSAIDSFTATDIFSAVQNADPRKAPAAVANALSTDKSDLGQLITAAGALTATVQEQVSGEQQNLNSNILPVTTKVSGETTAPSETVKSLFGIPASDQSKNTYTGTSVADVLKGIASFIKSPIGQWIKDTLISQCGLNPNACKGPSNSQSTIGKLLYGSGNATGVAAAQLLYATIGQSQIITGDPGRNEINVTEQLAGGGLIDSGFRQAIESTLTVKEAIDQGMLDAKKTFGFDKNGVEPREGYPFRGLQYLRKYRIIPVGWELAAKYSQEFDHRDLSLGYLISRYNICGQDQIIKKCALSGAVCTDDTACISIANDSCQVQPASSTHSVCSRGPKADQACQVDSDCGVDENGGRITCGASPYCGLVDPNWVLKVPQTYCRRQGAGEEIVTKEFVCDQNNVDKDTGEIIPAGVTCGDAKDATSVCTDVAAPNCVRSATNSYPDIGRWVIERNTDTCADAQSCIAENEDGSCRAFGYCVQERQQFKFNGTQCSEENSSCTAYTTSTGQSVAYLANTLDSRNCTADNAGCTQYCDSGSYDPATQQCTGTGTINFTGKVQSCDASQAGCRQFIQVVPGTNLLANGGFEMSNQQVNSGLSADFDGWSKSGTIGMLPVSPSDSTHTANNTTAVEFQGDAADTTSQIIHTGYDLFERSFTLSLRAKANASCSATLGLEVNVANQPQNNPDWVNRPRVPSDGNPNMIVGTDWQTFDVSLSIPSSDLVQSNLTGNYDLAASIGLGSCANQGLIVDSAQLEEGVAATDYKDYGSTNTVHLTSARKQCTVADVGCLAYTPSTGGSQIYGQVRDSNRCTADQVGCATFQMQPTTNILARAGGPVNIIAPKGQLCSAADVGCEEFTNLDEVAKGGEGKEYYSSIKQCVKPVANDPTQATYYTWVGDAKLGYVLRSYDMLKTNNAANGSAPCTSLSVGSVTTNPVCNDTAETIAAATCQPTEITTNPDCAQFYDSALTTYYRLRSKTVTVTEDCHPYRNTIDQSDTNLKNNVYYLSTSENVSCSAAAAGCRAYTGNTSGAKRQVFNDTFENISTIQWLGGTISNASSSVNGHSLLIPSGGPSPAAATIASILKGQIFGGKTYLVSFTTAAASSTTATVRASFGQVNGSTFEPSSPQTVFPGQANAAWNETITPKGPEWHSYTLGPLAVSNDLVNAQLGFQVTGGDVYIDNVTVSEVNDKMYLVSTSVPQCTDANVGCSAYTDSKGQKNYLTSFTRLCSQQVVNCQAMIDTQNSTSPFASTTKNVTTPADSITTLVNDPTTYCPASAKGCNVFGLATYAPDQKLIGYQSKYLINDPDRYSSDICLNNELSCQAFTQSGGSTVYFKDPSNRTCEYRSSDSAAGGWFIVGTSITCPTITPPLVGRPIGASCSPVCASHVVTGKELSTRVGQSCTSNTDCPQTDGSVGSCTGDPSTTGLVRGPSGAQVVGQCNSSSDCFGGNACVYMAGICASEQNGCTEYRDPTDPANCRAECPLSMTAGGSPDYVDGACQVTRCANGSHAGQNCRTNEDCFDGQQHSCIGADGAEAVGIPGCRSYYYIRQSIETNMSECNGKVNSATGCLPFNDTTNPNLYFRGQ